MTITNDDSLPRLADEIEVLKRKRRALVLAHNYQRSEVQDVADAVDDSLGLAQRARDADVDVIVLCGVRFMAETAALLNPDKKVILPDDEATCPMADMVNPRELQDLKTSHPAAAVVAYVNTTAETKALSDICCTSANAVKVVASLPPEQEVIFIPDRNLGAYVQKASGRRLILWQGFCPTHERIAPADVAAARQRHPGAAVVVHPECRMEVIAMADAVKSTAGMLSYCADAPCEEFVIGTEREMLYPLSRRCPGKRFWPITETAVCPNMKKITLAKVRDALLRLDPVITVPEGVAGPARRAIQRMLAVGRDKGA